MRDLIDIQIPKDFACPRYVEVDRALARRRYHPLTERKMMSFILKSSMALTAHLPQLQTVTTNILRISSARALCITSLKSATSRLLSKVSVTKKMLASPVI